MELALQSSLFEHAERRSLGSGAWVEVRSGWLTDAESLFDELMHQIPWRAERRQMYERVLDVPRLVSFHSLVDEPAPHPRLKQIRRRLNDTYAGELYNYVASFGTFVVIVTANPLVLPDKPVAPVDTQRAGDVLTAAVAAVKG